MLLALGMALPAAHAQAQAQTANAEAATRFVDGLKLPGKTGLEAARAADAQGFKMCRVVGGVLSEVPKEEPLIQCERDGANPYACNAVFQIVMRLDWGDRKLGVPEMLENIMATKVQRVTTLCS